MIFGSSRSNKLQLDTLVGPHTEVVGDLRFAGGVHVDGKVSGNVLAAGGDERAVLSIGENGVIDGDVRAPVIVLNGVVHGDVFAAKKITLSESARVVGNVHYRLIEMESGATVNGQLVRECQQTAASDTSGGLALNSSRAMESKS